MVRLTLAASVGALVACNSGPQQTVRCYQDPQNPDNCVTARRSGWAPMYYPMFYRGTYYGPSGTIMTPPAVGTPEYRAAQGRSVGTSFSPSGARPVSRGGIGSTGAGRTGLS